MYIPNCFAETNHHQLKEFIDSNSFGLLISNNTADQPVATHIPFHLDHEKSLLTGHLAKANPHLQALNDETEVLVVFQGPHGYISPSWYTSPGVPTWNYTAVHFYGRCSTFTDSQKLQAVIEQLTMKYEATQENPWTPSYNPELLQQIVGVEVTITEIQGKFKLSQNRSAEDRNRVCKALENSGNTPLAAMMKRRERS